MKALALSEQRGVVGDRRAQLRRSARAPGGRGQRCSRRPLRQEVQKRKKAAATRAARRDRNLRRAAPSRSSSPPRRRVGPLLAPRLRRAAARAMSRAPGGGRRAKGRSHHEVRRPMRHAVRAEGAGDGAAAAAFDGLQAKNVELVVHLRLPDASRSTSRRQRRRRGRRRRRSTRPTYAPPSAAPTARSATSRAAA